VRLYNAKTLKSDRILTRFQSPARAVAFNVTGSLAAVAGDEMTIKLVRPVTGYLSAFCCCTTGC